MLFTPFGPIMVFVDDVMVDYEAVKHIFNRPPVKNHPIAGCYRIHVPTAGARLIRCEVKLNDASIGNTGASGEKYMDAEFIKGNTILTIGAEDENLAFESARLECGMEYRLLQPIDKVVFGIAWATDYEGTSDCRTWFAADPTLHGERSST